MNHRLHSIPYDLRAPFSFNNGDLRSSFLLLGDCQTEWLGDVRNFVWGSPLNCVLIIKLLKLVIVNDVPLGGIMITSGRMDGGWGWRGCFTMGDWWSVFSGSAFLTNHCRWVKAGCI